jgi:hypothetical protein
MTTTKATIATIVRDMMTDAPAGAVIVSAQFDLDCDLKKGGRSGTPVNDVTYEKVETGEFFKNGKAKTKTVETARKRTKATYMLNTDWLAHLSKVAGKPVAHTITSKESWHRPVKDADGRLTPLACHKDDDSRLYWRTRFLTHTTPTLVDGDVCERLESVYYSIVDGSPIDREDLEPWLPRRSSSPVNVQFEDGTTGTVEPSFIFLVYSVENLTHLTFTFPNGERKEYEVIK